MAASDAPQYERDLRAAKTEWKRTKDNAAKWSYGSRHLHGITLHCTGDFANGATAPAVQQTKSRPKKKPSQTHPSLFKSQNIVKPRSAWEMPQARRRVAAHVHGEMQDALESAAAGLGPLGSPGLAARANSSGGGGTTAAAAQADPFLYSFDRAESPGRPLTLEVFVKGGAGARGGRETERLVEREYEVLDGNGEAVRGKRARAVLRRGAGAGGQSAAAGTGSRGAEGGARSVEAGDGGGAWEDEGFELI